MVEKKDKKSLTVYYFKFALFILLISGVLVLGKFIEKNAKNQKVFGGEVKKINNSKSITEELKEKSENMAKDIRRDAETMVDNVLGEATKIIQKQASSGADAVSDYIFQNTVGNLLKQIDKLPNRQKEQVKEEICR